MQIIYQALVLFAIITLSVSRPQSAIENQDSSAETQPAMSDFQKYYSSYRFPGAGGYMGVEETNPLDRMQMQVMRNSLYSGNSGNGLNTPGSAAYWDPIFRIPEMKRQVRYRQCYFNPISCF